MEKTMAKTKVYNVIIMDLAYPCATAEEKICLRKKRAERYYEE